VSYPYERPRRPTLSHRVEHVSTLSIRAVMAMLPMWSYAPLARLLSCLWYYLLPIRRDMVLQNLALAFPDKPVAWRRVTARACMTHFWLSMGFESVALYRRGRKALPRMLAEGIEGYEHMEPLMREGKPCIILGAHFGNWELGVSYFSGVEGLPVTGVAKPMHNPLIEAGIERHRNAWGWETISTRGDPIRRIMKAFRAGTFPAMLADQDARRNGVFVPFFGRMASTPTGPAVLAVRLKVPIVVILCRRSETDGLYHLRCYPPLMPDPEADRAAETERLTRAHVAILEEAIREHPEQYFWFHRRWKTRPKAQRASRERD